MEPSADFRVQLGVGRCTEAARRAALPAFYIGTPAYNALLYDVQSVRLGPQP
jgi:hypothetical protein